jgi:hypothetical protein
MSLKKKKVTKAMIERYEILRRLYISDKTVDDLASEMSHVPRQIIVNGLGKLLTNAAIKKIHFTEERIEITEIQIAKDLAGVKDKQFIRYHLTEHGRKKLAYYEWKYKMHEKVKFEWAESFNQKYYDEMTRLITDVMHLPT